MRILGSSARLTANCIERTRSCRKRRRYGVSTADCFPVTRLNASVNFVVDDLTAAFDNRMVR